MKITSQEIRTKLQTVWPDLEYIWLWDTTYWTPTVQALQTALDNSNCPKMQFIDEFNDCDNYALQFLAEARRKRYLQWIKGDLVVEQRWSVSLGFVFGNQFRGVGKLHAANLCLCEDGEFYVVDSTPQENRLWKADKENDNILFVFM